MRSCNSAELTTDAEREAGNGAAIDTSSARHGADAEPVTERGNNFKLLIHGADPQSCGSA